MLLPPKFHHAIRSGASLAILVDVEHPSGDASFWDGFGELEYNGKVYRGRGILGGIDSTRKSAELRIDEVKLWVSGVNPEEAESLEDNIKNCVATIRIAALNQQNRVLAVYKVDDILLDYQKDLVGEDLSIRIELVGQSGFWILERSTDAAWSQEEAVLQYPEETGFSMISALKNKDTPWTRTAD